MIGSVTPEEDSPDDALGNFSSRRQRGWNPSGVDVENLERG
jgi:hypothetical protein